MTTQEFSQHVVRIYAVRQDAAAKLEETEVALREAMKEWLKDRQMKDAAAELDIRPQYLGDVRDGRRAISEFVMNKLLGLK